MNFANGQHLTSEIPPMAANVDYSIVPTSGEMGPHRDEGAQQKEFQCPVCLKYFSRKFTLEMHLLIHKGIKPHQCPFCGKCFRQKGTLMRHKALHSSTALFHCQLCNKNYRQKNVFLHHLRHRHMVRTDNLDRRKCTTQLADADSLAEELPPFAVADKTALNASDKKLEAMLFNSLKPGGDSNTSMCDPVGNGSTQSGQGVGFRVDNRQQEFLNALAFGSGSGNVDVQNSLLYMSGSNSCARNGRSSCEKSLNSMNGSVVCQTRDVVIKWECNVCSYKCPLESPECEAHLKIHKSKYPYECVSCKMLFSTVCSYREHIVYHQRILSFSAKENNTNLTSSDANFNRLTDASSAREADSTLPSVDRLLQTVGIDPLLGISVNKNGNANQPEGGLFRHSDSGDKSGRASEFEFSCIPCRTTFANEEDFECHLKTHVQTYLACDSSDSDNYLERLDNGSGSGKDSSSGGSEKETYSYQQNLKNTHKSSDKVDEINGTNGNAFIDRSKCNGCYSREDNAESNLENNTERDSENSAQKVHKKGSDNPFGILTSNGVSKSNDFSVQESLLSKKNHKRKKTRIKRHILPVYCCPFCEQFLPDRSRLRDHTISHVRALSSSICSSGEKLSLALNHKEDPKSLESSNSSPLADSHEIQSLRNLQLLLATDKGFEEENNKGQNEKVAKEEARNITNMIADKKSKQDQCWSNSKPSARKKIAQKSNIVYFCYQCDKSFAKKAVFRYHNLMHLALPKLRCSFCRQSFARKDQLLRHTRTEHMGNTYQCSYCKKNFQYRIIYKHHEKSCRDRNALAPVSPALETPLCVPVVRIRDVPLDDTVLGIIPVAGVGESAAGDLRLLQLPKYGIPVISPHRLVDKGTQKSVDLPIVGKIILSDLAPASR